MDAPDSPDSLTGFLRSHGPVEPPPSFAVGRVVDDWELTAFLGRGGSAEVYRVRHATLGTVAAMKILMRAGDAPRERFLREARLLASFSFLPSQAIPSEKCNSDSVNTLPNGRGKDSARGAFWRTTLFRRSVSGASDESELPFPRFSSLGSVDGHSYMVIELLEPLPLPSRDRAVAQYLLRVCAGVARLHALGYVHRDIKPRNILFRVSAQSAAASSVLSSAQSANSAASAQSAAAASAAASPVLIDLGLVKKIVASSVPAADSVSIVDGKAVGVGTPRYAAPEQFDGGEISPATDIHALGMLANECFGGRPPAAWAPIIRRATSTIPGQRYATVPAFAAAIRRRHLFRNLCLLSLSLFVVCFLFFILSPSVAPVGPAVPGGSSTPVVAPVGPAVPSGPSAVVSPAPSANSANSASSAPSAAAAPASASPEWLALCRSVITNDTRKFYFKTTYETNTFPQDVKDMPLKCRLFPVSWYSNIVTTSAVTLVRLKDISQIKGKRNRFADPIILPPNSDYRIEGPGILDAAFGPTSNVTVHLCRCVCLNRTTIPLGEGGIKYVLDGNVYLNFTHLPRAQHPNVESCRPFYVDSDVGACNYVRLRGPESVGELYEEGSRKWYRSIREENNSANDDD